jgi:hypothetical protein
MGPLHNPPLCAISGIALLRLRLFPTLANVRDIVAFLHHLLRRLSGIAFVSAQMLVSRRGSPDHNGSQGRFQELHVVSVRPAYD